MVKGTTTLCDFFSCLFERLTNRHAQFDDSYQQLHRVAAVGEGLLADLHEFQITPQNTALLTVYNMTHMDLRSHYGDGFATDSYVWDCLFQEIDLATNELLFQWRASDHFTLADCYHAPDASRLDGANEQGTFDWFHINSIDKHPETGDYLISARYSHALTLIDGKDGHIKWHLGGRNSSFTDLSGGKASNFKWQHDARWQHGQTAVSLFDNAAYFADKVDAARGLLIDLDFDKMTASLRTEWLHPKAYMSESQGSLQLLSGTDTDEASALLGYGAAPTFSLFDRNGQLLCDVAFGALHWKQSGEFSPGAVMSYRVRRHAWIGKPAENPRAAFSEGNFYVSWNGDTRAREWRLESATDVDVADAGAADGSGDGTKSEEETMRRGRKTLCTFSRQGFESSCALAPTDAKDHLAYRLSARDAHGELLGSWRVDGAGTVVPIAASSPVSSSSSTSSTGTSPSTPSRPAVDAAEDMSSSSASSASSSSSTPAPNSRTRITPLALLFACALSVLLGYCVASRRHRLRHSRRRNAHHHSPSNRLDSALDGAYGMDALGRRGGEDGDADADADVEKAGRHATAGRAGGPVIEEDEDADGEGDDALPLLRGDASMSTAAGEVRLRA